MDADAGADDNDDGNDVDDDDDDDDDDATTILIVECVLLASAQVDANSGSLHCVFKLYSLKTFYENSLAAIYIAPALKRKQFASNCGLGQLVPVSPNLRSASLALTQVKWHSVGHFGTRFPQFWGRSGTKF